MAVVVPTLRHERRLWNEGLTRVVGVDEVGVAPTCGAVVAAAVIMKPGCHRIPGVRDSKTLSMLQRERLAPLIRKRAVAVGVGAASVREIDQLNIYHATHLAMRRAIARVGGHEHVIVDGNRIVGFEAQVGPYSNVIDGDAKVYSIACASIVARAMAKQPEERYQSAEEMLGDLNAVIATLSGATKILLPSESGSRSAVTLVADRPQPAQPAAHKRRWLPIALGTALLGILLIALMAKSGRPPTTETRVDQPSADSEALKR